MDASETSGVIGRDCESLRSYVPLAKLADAMPCRRKGRKTNVATVYRWTSKGCRGIKLRSIQIGATRCSTIEWLSEFFEALTLAHAASPATQSGDGAPVPAMSVRTSAARLRSHQAAERELAKLGY